MKLDGKTLIVQKNRYNKKAGICWRIFRSNLKFLGGGIMFNYLLQSYEKTIQKLNRIMIKMKLACLVVLLTCSGLSAKVWSQQERINLKFEQVTFVQLFDLIQQKTNLKFSV